MISHMQLGSKRQDMDLNSVQNHINLVKVLDVNHNATEMTTNSSTQCQSLPEVIELNVGGVFHTTSLSTLRKCPESMLAAMFSGRHRINTDRDGRFFIDRDGSLFHHILNFLREGCLPSLGMCLKVYHEAQFYNIQPMIDAMDFLRPIAGEKQKKNFLKHRQVFIDEDVKLVRYITNVWESAKAYRISYTTNVWRVLIVSCITKVPNYDSNLHMMLAEAQHIANVHPDRISRLKVCVHKEVLPSSVPPLIPGEPNRRLLHEKHRCDASVTFGPWTATPDVYDLIDCIKHDLAEKGYELEHRCIGVCDKHIVGQTFCKRAIFEFKFKWW